MNTRHPLGAITEDLGFSMAEKPPTLTETAITPGTCCSGQTSLKNRAEYGGFVNLECTLEYLHLPHLSF